MTVSTTTNRVSYTATIGVLTYTIPFPFISNSDLSVYVNGTLKIYGTDYSVAGAGAASGGSITFFAQPTGTLLIVRTVAYTQETDYQANDPFPAETHERALDKLTMMNQQIAEVNGRALRLPITATGTVDTTVPTPTAGYMLGWNATGTGMTSINPATYYQAAGSYNFTVQEFTGNGSTSAFTLSMSTGTLSNVEVFLNGVRQRPTSDYYLSGTNNTTLNFVAAPPSAAVILVRYGTTMAIGIPADGSVTYKKLASPGLGWLSNGKHIYNGSYKFTLPAYIAGTITLSPSDYLVNSLFIENQSSSTYAISTTSLAETASSLGVTVANGFAVEFSILNMNGSNVTLTGLDYGWPTLAANGGVARIVVVQQSGLIKVIRT